MTQSVRNREASSPAMDISLDQQLNQEWQRAAGGEPGPQEGWQAGDGGEWTWENGGVTAQQDGAEWLTFNWSKLTGPALEALSNLVIEVTVSGKAVAAGLSFGDYKDFMVDLDQPDEQPHFLQLELDFTARRWAFRVDGRLQNRRWWDSAVRTIDDFKTQGLLFKTRSAEGVFFQDLTVRTFQAPCQISVIITCNRFLQRLRVSLKNWCHQDLPSGAYEILVVNPNSPDGLHEHLVAAALSYPHVRLREVAVDPALAMNKGAMINRAVELSRGDWLWLTDADCLFAPACAAYVLSRLAGQDRCLVYGQRRYLSVGSTAGLLSGRLDGLADFDLLCRDVDLKASTNYPWGYTQIIRRAVLERIKYPEQFNHFAQSDDHFVANCKKHRVIPKQLDGLFCLHMDHPFAWYGTEVFL